jgi:hypothetical protein
MKTNIGTDPAARTASNTMMMSKKLSHQRVVQLLFEAPPWRRGDLGAIREITGSRQR